MSCVDSGIAGTISMHSNLSTICHSPKPTNSSAALQQQPIDELNSCSDDQSDYGFCGEEADKNEENSENLIDCLGKHASAPFLNASANIVGLSMLGGSVEYSGELSEETESRTLQQLGAENQKIAEYQTLSDEEFVAKYVLAEQICAIQFASNPVVPKQTIVSNRLAVNFPNNILVTTNINIAS